uniref:RNA polymerase sigma-70 region 4 domain-containing protein n=1 Tax=candidate division WWE3 bacterium TaxID=2053526 RepID=A0A831Z2J7_UNCKA
MTDNRRTVREAKGRLQQKHGRESFGAKELAIEAGMPERLVRSVAQLPWTVSMDETVIFEEGEGEKKSDSLADDINVEEEALIRIVGSELWKLARRILTPTQFEVIRLRYVERMLLREIGKKLGFTRQAASLHEQEALQKLRTRLQVSGSD